jgi:hypothetical protein
VLSENGNRKCGTFQEKSLQQAGGPVGMSQPALPPNLEKKLHHPSSKFIIISTAKDVSAP